MKKVELLAPVGNKEMLYQAIHNGADAVYLAGVNYGARKFSDNFTNEELLEVIKYAHLYDVKVYITINTLIFENEIEDFINYVKFIYDGGVDAVIVQDLGMIKIIKDNFPDLDIHASTQAHNHNKEGIKLLEELGVKRVVLAREMSLNTIKELNSSIEKEVFVYGALCVSYSGQCLFSSLNGGRSGNRGECVGSCRLPYELYKNNQIVDIKDKYLLSMKDLNTIDYLKEIIESRVDSLKIEGRMKSPYYVGYITKIYRKLIDNYYNNKDLKISDFERTNLLKLFNREFTKGFLMGEDDVTNIKSPNHQGIVLGNIIKCDKKYIYIKLNDDLNQEDGIRFKVNDKGMIVNRLYNEKGLLVNHQEKGSICLLDNKFDFKEDTRDVVLKTIDKVLISELSNYTEKKIKVSFSCEFHINNNFEITINDGINSITKKGSIVLEAIKHEILTEDVEKLLSKLGNTPFEIKDITINKDNNIFVGLKDINEVRRNLVDELIQLRRSVRPRTLGKKTILEHFNNDGKTYINSLVHNKEQLMACLDNKVDYIYVTDYNLYLEYSNLNNIFYRLDRVNNSYIDFDNKNLLVGELGSIYKYNKNNYLVGDYYLNVTNTKSIEVLNYLNVKRVTLSVELSDYQIKSIMSNNYDVELIIYGYLELMIMAYCPLKKVLGYCNHCSNSDDNFSLKDINGNMYPTISHNCLTHIMHNHSINKIDKINDYYDYGIRSYRLEFFNEDKNEVTKKIQEVFKILK